MTLTRMSEMIREWLGWCPEAGALRAAPAAVAAPPANVNPPAPEGGAGGSGRIDRGIRLALGSIRILIRNRKLLWFSLLIGLAMLFNLAVSLWLQIASGADPFPGTNLFPPSGTVLIAKGSLPWFLLAFGTTFLSTLLTFCLLGALFVCASGIFQGRKTPVGEGLSRVGQHLRPIAGWACIGSLVGVAFAFITNPGAGNIPVMIAAILIATLFGALTVFVVPSIVLGEEGLAAAIRGSVSMFWKVLGELIVCAVAFFLIVFVILLVTMVPIIAIGFSTGSAGMVGAAVILNMLIWIVILFIGVTVMGIATLGLYTYARTGRLPELFTGS